MTILKLDPFSGASGDMFLGALVTLAGNAGEKSLLELPLALGLTSVKINIKTVMRAGIFACKVDIEDSSIPEVRHLADINALIENSAITPSTKALARRIFAELAAAEAVVHNTTIDKIHFHEVGAIDSILDIIGSALLLDLLGISQTYSTPICVGKGLVKCAHGLLPIPAPATDLLLHDMECFTGEIAAEMTTPTGAAIIKALRPEFLMPTYKVTRSAYGAGSKDFASPNCLRLSLVELASGQDERKWQRGEVMVIQTNLDDTSGELLGEYLQNKLFSLGALDVSLYSMLMKKGRPGIKLEVLCSDQHLESLSAVILNETNAIGLRYSRAARFYLAYKFEKRLTSYGELLFKVVTLPSGQIRRSPEYEACKLLAEKNQVSLNEVYQEASKHLS